MTRLTVVLDTNIVLDWLVFGNAECVTIGERVCSGAWRWIASDAMRLELEAVLQYPAIQRWQPDLEKVRSHWLKWVCVTPDSALSPLRCTDGDDQKFIDLAIEHQARWLISKDRALLKLARAAKRWNVQVTTPGGLQTAELAGTLAASAAVTSLR